MVLRLTLMATLRALAAMAATWRSTEYIGAYTTVVAGPMRPRSRWRRAWRTLSCYDMEASVCLLDERVGEPVRTRKIAKPHRRREALIGHVCDAGSEIGTFFGERRFGGGVSIWIHSWGNIRWGSRGRWFAFGRARSPRQNEYSLSQSLCSPCMYVVDC